MKRWYVLKDQGIIGATSSREMAVDMVRSYQKLETHPLLRSEFSIMYGEQQFISYEKETAR